MLRSSEELGNQNSNILLRSEREQKDRRRSPQQLKDSSAPGAAQAQATKDASSPAGDAAELADIKWERKNKLNAADVEVVDAKNRTCAVK